MSKHLYCCQNMLQNYYDHIIPVPNDFNVNSDCLYGLSKDDFINGLKSLTEILKLLYADAIQNPAEYGLPLVEDIEYKPFNPKAADSGNSAHRIISLLYIIAQCGILDNGRIIVDKKHLSATSPKSIYKISNASMLYKKFCDYGFEIVGFNGKALDKKRDNFVLSYPDDNCITPALYGFMKNTPLQKSALFSLNYFLAIKREELPQNNRQYIFAQYISSAEREFFTQLDEHVIALGLIVGNKGDYDERQFRIEYLLKPNDSKCLVRCYSDFGKLKILLRLRKIDSYVKSLESMPEHIKRIFRADSNCRYCKQNCGYQNKWSFEGATYEMCGYMQYFEIDNFNVNDVVYYNQIISLEVEASRLKKTAK